MRMRQRLRFLHRFAVRDLLEPTARRSTRASGSSMAIVTALTLAAIGLALGSSEIKRAALARDRVLCLWVGNPNQKKFDPVLRDRLENDLRSKLGGGFLGGYPFHVYKYSWLAPGGAGAPHLEAILGRSLAPGDPLLTRCHLSDGAIFDGSDQGGVIISEKMRETLGLPRRAVPSTLTLELESGEREKVPLVGVVEKLPNGHEFVMTEKTFDELRIKGASPRAITIETGPVPADWPPPDAIPPEMLAEMRPFLEKFGVAGLPTIETKPDGRKVWIVRTESTDPPRLWQWATLLRGIRDTLHATDSKFADLSELHALEIQGDPPPAAENWRMVGFYVQTLEDLSSAAAFLRGPSYKLNDVQDDVIEDLKLYDRASSRMLLSCLLGAAVLLASSCANLRAIQELRSELKLGEIGMLKAMGMDNGLLRGVFAYEAVLVWCAGTLVGLSAGYAIGAALSWAFLAETRAEILVGFWCPWYIVGLLPLITGPTFLFSALLGTRRARRASPIMTLSPS
jgi:hypothetical protein